MTYDAHLISLVNKKYGFPILRLSGNVLNDDDG